MQTDLAARARDYIPVFSLIALVLLATSFDRGFAAPGNLLAVTADTMTLFLMAAGATLVIMTGGIDLSVQAVASMTSCIVAVLVPEWGLIAVFVALAAGALSGLASGVVTVYLRIPSFIANLAIGGIVTTVAYVVSDTRSVLIARDVSNRWLGWASGPTPLGINAEILVGLVSLIVLTVLLQRTQFGRRLRAVGAQERAVIASGIDVNRIKLLTFVISGFMAGLAGVVMAARLGSGSPTLANEFLLPAIAAIIVGGTALTGGIGSVWRTFVGALIIAVVRIGMTFIGVTVFAQQIVFGIMLVAAVAITMDRKKVSVIK